MEFVWRFNFKNLIAEGAFNKNHPIHLQTIISMFKGKRLAINNILENPLPRCERQFSQFDNSSLGSRVDARFDNSHLRRSLRGFWIISECFVGFFSFVVVSKALPRLGLD
jgi:hypothetical protein